jgi:enterochelin esterase-like enzyme
MVVALRYPRRRWLVGAYCVVWLLVALVGVRGYWESYYLHRGFAPVPRLTQAGMGQALSVNFYSRALRREADYEVFLPPGYGHSGRRYPVFYLLHGSPGRPEDFEAFGQIYVRLENLIGTGRARPMILVFPDGRIGGRGFSDSEWANTPSGDFENLVLNVVANVDRRFATLATRQARVIGGLSEGGYGATNIVLHHLDMFAGLQSWSGYFKETRDGPFKGASAATLTSNSPIDYVGHLRAELKRYPLRAFLYGGLDDKLGAQTPVMARALAAAGADVGFARYPGGHDWRLWNTHMDHMLELASQWMGQTPGSGGSPAPSGGRA